MKITGVEAFVCNARMRNWIFVKVLTDQDGLWGWGEATLEWQTKAVVGAIEDLSALIIGQDPRRIEYLGGPGTRLHPPLLSPRGWADGGLLRNPSQRRRQVR